MFWEFGFDEKGASAPFLLEKNYLKARSLALSHSDTIFGADETW